jgi:acetylglutamate kinase
MKSLLVAKVGGNVIEDKQQRATFLQDFAKVEGAKLLVHGGGKTATQVAEKLGIPTKMVDGRRITDEPMLEVVTMVYAGLVNKNIVADLQSLGRNAIGLTGADAGAILAQKRAVGEIDYGLVGDVQQVNATQLAKFIDMDLLPVMAPLTFEKGGSLLNTNADTIASSLAVGLAQHFEVTLLYCFEKKGVLINAEDDNSVIPTIDKALYAKLKADGVIFKGMIPKLDNAFAALEKGVSKVIICHSSDIAKANSSGEAAIFGTTLVL